MIWDTYCLGQSTPATFSTDEYHYISCLLHVLYPLPTSNICILGAREKCGDKHWCTGHQLRGELHPLQDVVLDDVGNDILVVVLECVVQ